jgi:hypothetical protein
VLAFCDAAETHARSLPPTDPRIREIADLTMEVLRWTRTMMQTARESLASQLRQIPGAKRYVPALIAMPASMNLEV